MLARVMEMELQEIEARAAEGQVITMPFAARRELHGVALMRKIGGEGRVREAEFAALHRAGGGKVDRGLALAATGSGARKLRPMFRPGGALIFPGRIFGRSNATAQQAPAEPGDACQHRKTA